MMRAAAAAIRARVPFCRDPLRPIAAPRLDWGSATIRLPSPHIIAQPGRDPVSRRIGAFSPQPSCPLTCTSSAVCGTFMGGLAAIAKAAGYRVTGCDANVYPPMSDQLAALGIELIEGYDSGQLKLAPDVWVVGNVVTRGNPLMEAILDRGDRYVSGPQWLAEEVSARKVGTRSRWDARQDDGCFDAGLDPRARRATTGVSDRRCATRLPGLGAADRRATFRDRGGRIRYGLLRQALEVRALPPANRDFEQS